MADNNQTKQIKPVAKGNEITASKENQIISSVNKLNSRVKKTTRRKGAGRQSQVIRLEIKSIEGDYLWCSEPGATAQIKIAKPYILRRTPFDSSTRNGITYTYISDTERSATDGTDTETQVVVPSYVAGDQIYAINTIINYSGVEDSGALLEWADMNTDARAWAKKAE